MMVYCYTFRLNFYRSLESPFINIKRDMQCEIYHILNYGISQLVYRQNLLLYVNLLWRMWILKLTIS